MRQLELYNKRMGNRKYRVPIMKSIYVKKIRSFFCLIFCIAILLNNHFTVNAAARSFNVPETATATDADKIQPDAGNDNANEPENDTGDIQGNDIAGMQESDIAVATENDIADMPETITVGAEDAMYKTLNEAISAAREYCSKDKRVLIYVYPGVYNEQIVLIDNPGIDIQGSGSDRTIVQYPSFYPFAPLYTNGTGSFRDISFVAAEGTNSYAFHYEIGGSSVTGRTVFQNCSFYSYGNVGVGAGLGADCTLEFYNCTMGGRDQAGLYIHNNPNENIYNQNVIIRNCRLTTKDAELDYCVAIDDACNAYGRSGSKMHLSVIDTDGISGLYYRVNYSEYRSFISAHEPNITLDAESSGNSIWGLNYDECQEYSKSIAYAGNNHQDMLHVHTNAKKQIIAAPAFSEPVMTSAFEYSWYATKDNGNTWMMVRDWSGAMDLCWTPDEYGEYVLVCKVRNTGGNEISRNISGNVSYHPAIKGICQMPYTGEGGGYLIGIESYENPNHAYTYEMLILDCTLYAQGLPAWIYSTGRCGAPDTCLWTVWQPQYGYYWTLFRIYDENGNLIDEMCFGFENIC